MKLEINLTDGGVVTMPVCDFHLDYHKDAGILCARFLNCNEDVIAEFDFTKIKNIIDVSFRIEMDELDKHLHGYLKALFGDKFIELAPSAGEFMGIQLDAGK